jgi:hypothetical protein
MFAVGRAGEARDKWQKQFVAKIIEYRIVEPERILREDAGEARRAILGLPDLVVLESSGYYCRFDKTEAFVGIVVFARARRA